MTLETVLLFLLAGVCFAATISESDDYSLSLEAYLRPDIVAFKNVVDLDSANSDDTTTYLGIDYSLAFDLNFKNEGAQFYLKLERNGPFDYSAPLFVHNTLQTSGGIIEKYRDDELLPQLEEFWLDAPLAKENRFKIGLFAFGIANGFSLTGGYENYGFCVYKETENRLLRLHYARPEIVYKNHLGPRIRQEEEQEIDYNHNSSNFFSFDARFNNEACTLWPYIGVLADYTSSGKRANTFSAPIKKDFLGTAGFSWTLKQENYSLNIELARNFGKGISASPEYEDIYHSGYLVFTGIDYYLDKFTPAFKFLLASGNKVPLDAALNADTRSSGSRNRAFSYSSPLNTNLGESISGCNADRPVVATGNGYGVQYGVLRPGTFSSSDFDNLIMPSISLDFKASEKLNLGLYYYYLRAFAKGAGTLNGEAKRLSADLGHEIDLFVDYQLNPNVLLCFLAGYFLPGEYYKEIRDDTDGSLLSPFIRGDGKADPAFQIELSLELKF